jgi:hypothetical protein
MAAWSRAGCGGGSSAGWAAGRDAIATPSSHRDIRKSKLAAVRFGRPAFQPAGSGSDVNSGRRTARR